LVIYTIYVYSFLIPVCVIKSRNIIACTGRNIKTHTGFLVSTRRENNVWGNMSRKKNSITVCLDDDDVKIRELSWGTENYVNAGT